ncbi:hypothetical protein [Undibacterium flavidum]|uniref:Uncharacterized protein n=1 Tax=Undibacterium flavidum TaxID=2762297 RepID=A0ABR6Y8B7_9BURK|nr:hypothetical protein [Undibacterium flavidum]MBC3872884.1 hypothetical protein [Undibacterium flavidum]
MKSLFILMMFLISLSMMSEANAHGNDDHEHAAPAASIIQVAPRASAQTEDFELVVVLQGRSLIIYLDRFANNELVAGAQIEVESGNALNAPAKQIAPGVYVLELAKGVFDKAGKYPLAISVQAGEIGDVMAASLEIPDLSEQEHAHAEESRSWWWPALAAASLILALLTIVFVRQRRAKEEFK